MQLPIDWTDDGKVRALFSWQTRIGLAPKFGTLPIGWYQIWQCAAYDLLVERLAGEGRVRTTSGIVEGKRADEKVWRRLGSVNELGRLANDRSRQ